jgi:hypothetical protein
MSARIAANNAGLILSLKNVGFYRNRLMQKLSIDGLAGLVKFKIASGLPLLDRLWQRESRMPDARCRALPIPFCSKNAYRQNSQRIRGKCPWRR